MNMEIDLDDELVAEAIRVSGIQDFTPFEEAVRVRRIDPLPVAGGSGAEFEL
jgi:hypothetical protein